MFLGTYEHSLDDRGRVAIPARFRKALVGGLVVSRGFDPCIIAYPLTEWPRVTEQLISLPLTDTAGRRLLRATTSEAYPVDLDRQGRVLLPAPLREFAQIENSSVVVGMQNHLEIWASHLWQEEKRKLEEQVQRGAIQPSSPPK